MNKELGGKGYIQGGEGVFIASTGERYEYHDGRLTRTSAGALAATPADQTNGKPQGAIEMKHLGTSELQPLHDSRRSFYGKAFVERYAGTAGTRLVLKSYGTVVAVVTPLGEAGESYRVEIAMRHLSATTLRHVKEFLAQTDDAFKGITLDWLRKAVRAGRPVEGEACAYRKVYTLDEL